MPSRAAGDVENLATGTEDVCEKRQVGIGGRRNGYPEINRQAVEKIMNPIVGRHFISINRRTDIQRVRCTWGGE